MKKVAVFFLLVILWVVPVISGWNFIKTFPASANLNWMSGVNNGIVVDRDGKIWIQSYSDVVDSIDVGGGTYRKTGVIRVFNPDGSEVPFSPIKTITVTDNNGTTTDTLFGTGNGLTLDHQGNIISVKPKFSMYRIDYKTGAGMKKMLQFPDVLVTPAVDSLGYIYIAFVNPNWNSTVLNSDFTNSGSIVSNNVTNFGRCIAVTKDGKDVFIPRFDLKATLHYHNNLGPQGNYTFADTVLKGLVVENSVWDKKANLWVTGGNAASGNPDPPYSSYTWYAYNVQTHSIVDSIQWNGNVNNDPRPRGIAFSVTGDTAYVAVFHQDQNFVQMFRRAPAPVQKIVTFQAELDSLILEGFDVNTDSVIVNGDFNGWNNNTKMTRIASTSQYQYTTTITRFAGDTVQFKFRAFPAAKYTNGGWDLLPPTVFTNRKFVFSGTDTVLPFIRPAIHKVPTGPPNTKSALLDGFQDRIRITDGSPVNPNAKPSTYIITGHTITVEAWIFPMNVPPPGSGYTIISRPYFNAKPWQSYELRINNFGNIGHEPRIEFIISDGDTAGHWGSALDVKKVRVGQWTHVAGTYDGSMVKLYINDTLVSANPYSANLGAGNTGLYIGGITSQYFQGMIDEVRLWNIARAQNEIQSWMNATLVGNESGLVGYWPMDSTYLSGNNVVTVDRTSNHNDLIVQFDTKILPFPEGSTVTLKPTNLSLVSDFGEAVSGAFYRAHLLADGWPRPSIAVTQTPQGMGVNGDSLLWIPSENQFGQFPVIATVTNVAGSLTDTVYVYSEALRSSYNQLEVDVTNRGKIGTWGQYDKGLKFRGRNGLFLADFSLVDRNSAKYAGGLYSTQNSFHPLEGFTDAQSRLPGFTAFRTSFDDAWEPNRIGVRVTQTVYSSTNPDNDKYAIVEFKTVNQSGSPIDDLFAQLSTDFDIGAVVNNWGGYDSLLQMSYGFEIGGANDQNFYGFSLLNRTASGAALILNGQDSNYFRSTKNLTNFVYPSLKPGDTRNQISAGPYSLAVGETLTVAFAVLAGDNLADISQSAFRARQAYNSVQGINISNAKILAVKDVPNDNGKQVRVTWKYSPSPAQNGIQKFAVWRMDSVRTFVGEAPSLNDSLYSIVVPTLFDSTKSKGIYYSRFQISAHTLAPFVYSVSVIDSGYSLDNLVPQAPGNLNVLATGPTQNTLKWNGVPDKDLFSYKVYRSTSATFTPDISTFLGYSADTLYVDNAISPNVKYYYTVTAIDYSGNESASAGIVTSVHSYGEQVPTVYSLSQNYPNPFNPATTIQFGIPEASNVTLKIYDALGREVATLVDGQLSPAYYSYTWSAGNLSSGMYIYRMTATSVKGEKKQLFNQVKKLLLMK